MNDHTSNIAKIAQPRQNTDDTIANTSILILVCFSILTVLTIALGRDSFARWAIYAFPFISAASMMAARARIAIPNPEALIFLILFTLSLILSLSASQGESYQLVREMGLFFILFATPFCGLRLNERATIIAIVSLFLATLVITILMPKNGEIASFSVLKSSSPLEFLTSVTFGAIAIIAFHRGWKYAAALAAIACIITFKRNAIGALTITLLIGSLAYTLPANARKFFIVSFVAIAAVVNIVFPSLFGGIALDVTRFIFPRFSPEEITLGRSTLYFNMLARVENWDLQNILFGDGPGMVKLYLLQRTNIELPHNETLHMYSDYGLFGLVVFWGFIIWSCWKAKAPLLAAYLLIALNVENFIFVYLISIPTMMVLFAEHSTSDSRKRLTDIRAPKVSLSAHTASGGSDRENR